MTSGEDKQNPSGEISFNLITFSNLFLNSGTFFFFFFFTPYAFSGFYFITTHLSIFQTLPTAHDLLQKGRTVILTHYHAVSQGAERSHYLFHASL